MGTWERRKYWYHKKYKKQFEGHYFWARKQREFVLKAGSLEIVFESHEAAKKLGWYRA
jgi:hypothetical protein